MRRCPEDHAQSTRYARAGQALASIDDEEVMPDKAGQALEKILAHIDAQVLQPKAATLPQSRAPPQLKIDDDWLWVRPILASLFATSGMVRRAGR